jgi:hypothetical protein
VRGYLHAGQLSAANTRKIMCYYIYKRKESGAVFLMQWTYERNEAQAIVEQKRESLAGQGWHVFFIER